jgi:GNAT superfamily N-acetyltransferase
MPSSTQGAPILEFHPVTAERLADLARFSKQHGRFRYCSCMRWRMTSTDYHRSTRESRVAALEELVRQGTPVGVLAYVAGEPVGWCSIAPRETYAALECYQALPRVDDASVWSVVCFFVDRRVRRQGVTLGLPKAAVEYARSHGAAVVEGYPVEPGSRLYTYMGSPSTFQRAGFHDVTPAGQAGHALRRGHPLTLGAQLHPHRRGAPWTADRCPSLRCPFRGGNPRALAVGGYREAIRL